MSTSFLLIVFLASIGGIAALFWDHWSSFAREKSRKIEAAIARVREAELQRRERKQKGTVKNSAPQETGTPQPVVSQNASEKKDVAEQMPAPAEEEEIRSEAGTHDEPLTLKETNDLLRRAELFLAREEFPEAERLFIHILAFDENHPKALQKLAYLYLQTESYPKAETLYRQLAEAAQNDAGIYTNLGLTLFHQKNFAGAIGAYEKAIALDPERAARYANLGQVLFVHSEMEKAIECFRTAVAKEPRNIHFLYLLADACLEAKHFVEAKKWYERILDFSPYDEDAKEEVRRLKALGF